MRTIVVDDERHVRETLCRLIGRYCADVEVVATAGCIAEARELIVAQRPDLLFLDVEMPGGSGFELLGGFATIDFGLVFVTAHDRYALRALKLSALDYILKPVDPTALCSAVAKAAARRAATREDDWSGDRFRDLAAGILRGKLAVPIEEGFAFIGIDDLVRCEACGSYTTLHMADGGTQISSRTLRDYETALSDAGFVRVHHSHLINIRYIASYARGRGGLVRMDDGTEITVSARRRDSFLERMRQP